MVELRKTLMRVEIRWAPGLCQAMRISPAMLVAAAAAAFALILPGTEAGAAKPSDARSRYASCLYTSRTDPETALQLAQGWRDNGGGLPAAHCLSIALVRQGRFAEAAGTLEEVAVHMKLGGYFFFGEEKADRPLLAELYAQAGNAWLLADEPQKAYEDFTSALGIVPARSGEIVEYLIDRARSLAALDNFEQAVADLKKAEKQADGRIEIHVFMASAYRQLGQFEPAEAELAKAFNISEENREALLERGNLHRQAGDAGGALLDWIKLVRLHPDTEAALAARANLKAMGISPEDWKGIEEVEVTGQKRPTQK